MLKKTPNVDIVFPKKKFPTVLAEDGFPITNKKQARIISKLQNPSPQNFNSRRLGLIGYAASKDIFNLRSKVSKKWLPLVFSDLRVTAACCDFLKKDPLIAWKKENPGLKGFNGMMMGEGETRDLAIGLRECNVFDNRDPTSIPLKFWTEADVWGYAERFNVEICSVYKDFDLKRTGCTFCAYGAEMEDSENNRFIKLRESHPVQFNFFINKLGMNKALDYAGINYGEEAKNTRPEIPLYSCFACQGQFSLANIGFITERAWTGLENLTKPPTAGMNLYCPTCAKRTGFPQP